jgi:hypothetical protein
MIFNGLHFVVVPAKKKIEIAESLQKIYDLP